MKILWICGRLPAPLFSGDALYTAGLLKALVKSDDVSLTVLGVRRTDQDSAGPLLGPAGIRLVEVPAPKSSGLWSLASSLPKDAYTLCTPEFQQELGRLLRRDWDWIVVDHAYSAGALSTILRGRGGASLCYIAHNAEGLIRPKIASGVQNPIRGAATRLDAEKYRRLEHGLLDAADAVVCITSNDAAYFQKFAKRVYVIPPVFLGTPSPRRTISADCPRSLLLLGEFKWIAKQRNLEIIIDALLPPLQRSQVSLNVVGVVPQHIQNRHASLRPYLKFHGRLADPSPLFLSSRGGLVPELFGGGFKLKVMDYAFARLPIFGLTEAMAGTTAEEQSAMFLANNIAGLADAIVENVDNLDRLNECQETLLHLFSNRFSLDTVSTRLGKVFR
ncbi:glycosyltransferase [Bradyrhizobium commune]|uniref:Glycosyltransferase n=1 Tax=Bradyrhizobium commune TaxID=83627 RepID=A0A7S9GXV4_9BRAD|nr:glycosyltransferase [Bradyrhizobium commune]QPF90270.1 glycosyltransferase [Bradyrhizobium commune]